MTAMTISLPVMAQNQTSSYKTTGYVTDENNITRMVTQEVSTRLRRTTSQGDPNAKLSYTPGITPEKLAIPLSESVMARYPDYKNAYWKDYTYVQGYMFEAMDRLGQLRNDSKYTQYMKVISKTSLMRKGIIKAEP